MIKLKKYTFALDVAEGVIVIAENFQEANNIIKDFYCGRDITHVHTKELYCDYMNFNGKIYKFSKRGEDV